MNPFAELRKVRERCGISAAEVAHQANVSQASLSRWENGKAKPLNGVLASVRNALAFAISDRIEQLSLEYDLTHAVHYSATEQLERKIRPALRSAP